MKSRSTTLCSALVTSIALAFAAPAFAQDNTPPSSNPSDQSSPSDMSSNPADSTQDTSTQPAPHRNRHRRANREPAPSGIGAAPPSDNPEYNANTAKLSGNEPEVRAYQKSDRQKRYPAVDHGHVAGDPPVIDHSGDQAPVDNPTHTTVALPPQPAPSSQ